MSFIKVENTIMISFYLDENGQPENGVVFTLVNRRKEPLIEDFWWCHHNSQDEQGVVRFSQIRGGIYWAHAENQKSLPKIKGYIYLLKHQQFRIRSRRKSLTKKNAMDAFFIKLNEENNEKTNQAINF